MKHVAEFRKAFKIAPKVDLRDVAVAIEATYKANEISSNFLANYDSPDPNTGLRVHCLLNLLGRVFEHVQAMLVALATGSPASSEALGRTVVEGSINIQYLAEKGDTATLIFFLRSWLKEHERKLSEWRQKIQGEPYESVVSEMIRQRQGTLDSLVWFVNAMETDCFPNGVPSNSTWPKSLFKRFEALGRETDYYESYHRLSGASHITGEDTIGWLASLQASDELRYRFAKEAWAYSTMMSRIACAFFVDAARSCVEVYGRNENQEFVAFKNDLAKSVQDIAKEAGVPNAPDA